MPKTSFRKNSDSLLEGLGYIDSWLHENGVTVSSTRIFEDARFPELGEFDGLIVLGGPMSVNNVDIYTWLAQETRFIEDVIAANKPVFGICLGAQLIAKALGASVSKNPYKEIGWFPVERVVSARQTLVETLIPEQAEVFHWHGETFELPAGATHFATSKVCANQAFLFGNRVIGLQFHLEITREGVEMLIHYCGSELEPGVYVQQTNELLRDEHNFLRVHSLINPILQYLFLF
jgi:GMP synthase-like glutamine amidotransferase